MNPVLQDFISDLQRLRRIFALSRQLGSFPSFSVTPESIEDSQLKDEILGLHKATREAHPDMPILNGVLLLYLAGRFENYVKEVFEDLCDSLADGCSDFAHLPKQMQMNLVKYTAEVIANPRKYGHADNGVIAFVNTLADNLNHKPLAGVNSKCLSITELNMWPDTVSEIFGRIGVDKIWERIGQQACVQAFFQVSDASRATSEARNFLKEFMEMRNKIAHPSDAFTWPSIEQASRHVDYCETVATAIADLCMVWAATLPAKLPAVQQASAGDDVPAVPQS